MQPILRHYMEVYCNFSSRMYPSVTHQEYMNNLCMYIYHRYAGNIAKDIILLFVASGSLWSWCFCP